MMESVELILYGAFEAPKDDIFYLPEEHPDRVLLRANTIDHQVENYEKYRKHLKKTIHAVTSTGAAFLQGME